MVPTEKGFSLQVLISTTFRGTLLASLPTVCLCKVLRVFAPRMEMRQTDHSGKSAAFLQVKPQRQICTKLCGFVAADYANVFKIYSCGFSCRSTANIYCGFVADTDFPLEINGEIQQQIHSVSTTEMDVLWLSAPQVNFHADSVQIFSTVHTEWTRCAADPRVETPQRATVAAMWMRI